jgi:hypothetical protein
MGVRRFALTCRAVVLLRASHLFGAPALDGFDEAVADFCEEAGREKAIGDAGFFSGGGAAKIGSRPDKLVPLRQDDP